jgi:hypothetical protein
MVNFNPLFPIETPTWRVEQGFLVDARLILCQDVHGVTKYPPGAKEIEIALWNAAVEKKKATLEAEGKLELKLESIEGRHALYARAPGDTPYKQAMVPGYQYRFVEFDPRDLILSVERVIYSELEALKNEQYRTLFEQANLPLPYGPIAPALIILTADGYIAASKRGNATNKYPGAIWGFGGDIDNPTITVGDHLERVEKKEELSSFRGISPQYYSLGLIYDKVLRKHDMPVMAQYPVPFSTMKKGDKFLPDVESILPISNRIDDLENYLTSEPVISMQADDKAWVGRPTPPWSADLFLLGKYLYKEGWAERVLKELNGTVIEQPVIVEHQPVLVR